LTDRRGELGREGEDLACAHIEGLGMEIVERNWRRRSGEIDIVAREPGTTVFVEVKTRRSDLFGRPEESVTPVKQARLRRLAGEYLSENRPGTAVRFDVVSVFISPDGSREITYIPDAF
jgi:putative endonuclease